MVYGLRMKTEFDIEPCPVYLFVKHLLDNSYEPSTGVEKNEILT